jgi:hypothetical protein
MENQTKGSAFLSIISAVSVVGCAAAAYVAFDTYMTRIVLSKSHFICTQIEQVGKNMDDVVCTQYTAQKFAKQAVAANALLVQR